MLYWNNAGVVNCGGHAPYMGSDTWTSEEWVAVPDTQDTAHLKCETCKAARERRARLERAA